MSPTRDDQTTAELEEFVGRFATAWAEPAVERFAAMFHPDIVLQQPVLPRMVGKEAAVAGFERLLGAFPAIRGEVLDWSGNDEAVYITLRLRTGGRRPLDWTVVDKIRLEGELIRERVSYFDGLPLLVGTLLRPRLWPRLAQAAIQR